MSELFEDMTVSPEAAFDNALNSLTKKTAASIWSNFKRMLSTASEPFFRKAMGERYCGADKLAGGVLIWIIATVIALLLPEAHSAVAIICRIAELHRWGNLSQHWLLPVATCGALVFFNLKFGRESVELMAKYRAEGTAYHTQSRGTPRWGNQGINVGAAIVFGLLLFNIPAGILFIASCVMSSKLASEQEAAIYSRYLDALDQRIEQEYLESAILGRCPTEITQLIKPLPANMNSDLRNNIAAAAVGKAVKIVAKAPGKSTATSTP